MNRIPVSCMLLGMLIGAVWLLSGCGDLPWQEAAGGGSATETTGGAKVTGSAVYPDGMPAAGAVVALHPNDYLRDSSGAVDSSFHADAVAAADGSYRFDSIPSGEYFLEVRDAKGNAAMAEFRKDVERGNLARKADTLRATGSLYGTLGPMDGAPGAGYVQVFGLGRGARADSNGHYRLNNLPYGRLRLRALSSRPLWHFRDTLFATVLPGDSSLVQPFLPFQLGEDYAAWGSSRTMVLNTVGREIDSDVVDFPLLVRLSPANFDFSRSNGKDLRFADAQGRHLPFAVEHWDSAAGSAAIWVKLDTVRTNRNDQAITLFWNRPGAPDRSDPPAVFASFAGVWHLSDSIATDGAGTFRDASPSGADGNGTVSPGDGDGQVANGRFFQGAHSIRIAGTPSLKPVGGLCLSAWIRMTGHDTLGGEIATLGENYGLRADTAGKVYFYLQAGSAIAPVERDLFVGHSANGLLDSQWHLVTGTFDGADMRIFADGVEVMSSTPPPGLAYPFGRDFRIGSHGRDSTGYGFFGSIDEVQVSPKIRTPAWIRLSFENQKGTSDLLGFR